MEVQMLQLISSDKGKTILMNWIIGLNVTPYIQNIIQFKVKILKNKS